MVIATIANIFGITPSTGANIFHEIAAEGSMILLDRVGQFVMPSIRFLLKEENYSGRHCVHIVAYIHKGQLAIQLMEKLLSLGADINAKNRTGGDSVLHQAVLSENYDLVTWMCQQSAIDMGAVNHGGQTAYQVAFDRKDEKMMDILKTFEINTSVSKVYKCYESD